MPIELRVAKNGQVMKVIKTSTYGTVIEDKPYQPNGKSVFVNPKTNFLEETEPVPGVWGRQRKANDLTSNGNRVLHHPTRKEFAEVKSRYGWATWDKVKKLPIAG